MACSDSSSQLLHQGKTEKEVRPTTEEELKNAEDETAARP